MKTSDNLPPLSLNESAFQQWAVALRDDEAYTGAIGGRFTLRQRPLTAGTEVSVIDEVSGSEFFYPELFPTHPTSDWDTTMKEKLSAWVKESPRRSDEGRLVFIRADFSLGTVFKVTDSVSGEVLDVTDYEQW